MRLQVIMNPAFADIVNSEDRYNALKDWLEKDGVKDPDQFCTDPKKIAQEKIAQMQGQLQQMQGQAQGLAKAGEEATKSLQASKNQKKDVDAQAAETKQASENMEANTAMQVGKETLGALFQ